MGGLKQAILQILRLAYPYFTTRDETEVSFGPFGRFRMQERWVALALMIVVVAIEFGQVAINVRLSYFNRDWFNAIQEKNATAFWTLLFTVFCFWAAIFVASAIYQYALQSYLRIRWRQGAYDDAAIAEALRAARLPQFAGRLHEEGFWAQSLSL